MALVPASPPAYIMRRQPLKRARTECADELAATSGFHHLLACSAPTTRSTRVSRRSSPDRRLPPPRIHIWLTAPNVLFTCRALAEAIYQELECRGTDYRPLHRPTDPLPPVNGRTIHQFKRMIRAIPFTHRDVPLQSASLPALHVDQSDRAHREPRPRAGRGYYAPHPNSPDQVTILELSRVNHAFDHRSVQLIELRGPQRA